MAYDAGHAQLMQEALHDVDGITEKKMFGGLCFMFNGHMVCGVHQGGDEARLTQIVQMALAHAKSLPPK